MKAYLIAGVLAGIAGLLVFLVIHHLWTTPIWFILPLGLVIAGIGGLAVGWAYAEIQVALPPRPWTALALAGLIAVTLLPAIILAELRPALFTMSGTEATLTVSTGRATFRFISELLVTAALVGGVAGWSLGHKPRAALASALAGLVFALGPGHNIPFLGNTPAVGKGIALLGAVVLVSAIVLVEATAALQAGNAAG